MLAYGQQGRQIGNKVAKQGSRFVRESHSTQMRVKSYPFVFSSVKNKNTWYITICFNWQRGQDLNLRPLGYEPNELPNCSTPRYWLQYNIVYVKLQEIMIKFFIFLFLLFFAFTKQTKIYIFLQFQFDFVDKIWKLL